MANPSRLSSDSMSQLVLSSRRDAPTVNMPQGRNSSTLAMALPVKGALSILKSASCASRSGV